MVKQFVISSGHGKYVNGATDILDEVDEARRVVNRVYTILTTDFNGVGFKFHDDISITQNQNLTTIVNFHNSKTRSLDISVHFNSAEENATGSECLYYTAQVLSSKMSQAMAKSLGIMDRGAKERKELYFLKETKELAILLEVCFVTSKKDVEAYKKNFEALCQAISKVIASKLEYSKKPKDYRKNYYTKKYDRLISITNINLYADLEFKKKLKQYKKDTNLTIIGVDHTKSGVPRFRVKGGYVTTNRKYVEASNITTEYYTVKSGDTFSEIAEKYNTTIDKLKELNKDIKNIDKINIGQKIRVK